MKTVIGVLMGLVVLGLGFWAYQENYKTRDARSDLRRTQREIVAMRERLAILNAEWAWLNRPERLRALVLANNTRLGLADMGPEHFGVLDQVAYPTQQVLSSLTDEGAAQ